MEQGGLLSYWCLASFGGFPPPNVMSKVICGGNQSDDTGTPVIEEGGASEPELKSHGGDLTATSLGVPRT